MKILVINPGSTSTKIAVYHGGIEVVLVKEIRHLSEELQKFATIAQQLSWRLALVIEALEHNYIELDQLDVVVGRGGLLSSISSGVYAINEKMLQDLHAAKRGEHASNLGALLAHAIASKIRRPGLIIDPVIVDELDDVARISGHPDFTRESIFHALNQKACARRFAKAKGQRYEDLNLIVAHMGGGITIGAHRCGRVVDVNNGLDGEGPFSPERSGTLPTGATVRAAFSGKYNAEQLSKMIVGNGGLVAYLGTNNAEEIVRRIGQGDQFARLIYQAMSYQIARSIGASATVLCGKIDQIILTGGLARCDLLMGWLRERISFLGEITLFPGENELLAMAEGAYYAMVGGLEIKEY